MLSLCYLTAMLSDVGMGINDKQGRVYVKSVVPGSAAQAAGICQGDDIVKVNNTLMEEKDQVAALIQQRKPGDTMHMQVLLECAVAILCAHLLSDHEKRRTNVRAGDGLRANGSEGCSPTGGRGEAAPHIWWCNDQS